MSEHGEVIEIIDEDEAIRRGMIAELEPWMEELFPTTPIMFAHAPLEILPFRYVGIVGRAQGLLVICSASWEADGKRWMHVSMSRHSRLPTYEDMCMVKDAFIGRERMAVQVFARAAEHVNHAPLCLHLWSCLDGDPTPDFRHGGVI